MRLRPDAIGVEFIDLVFNLVVILVVLLVLTVLLIKTEGKPSVEREGKYVVVITWNEGVDADVDLWVKAPNGEASGFLSRDKSGMSLLRDDLGNINDRYTDEKGQEVLNKMNREEVTLRSPMGGEYIVNVHYYRSSAEHPKEGLKVSAELKLVKENTTLVSRDLVLQGRGDELTAFTFKLDDQHNVVSTDKTENPIIWVVRQR